MGHNLPGRHGDDAAVNRDFEDLGGVNPYEMLGVPPDADTMEIKRAYRRLVLTAHTDRGGDGESLRRLNLAREVLLDRARRIEIDQRLRRQRGGDDEILEEVPIPEPEPQAAPSENQFGWTYGTGPAQHTTSQPTPEPQATPHKDQFSWTYGTGPSTPPPLYQWQPYTKPVYRQPVRQRTRYRYPAAPRDLFRRQWNRLAIASLVVSLLFWPVGLPMGVIAVVQVRRRNQRGAGLAWIAIGWSVLALCIVVSAGRI